jgi:hypothetical protein
MSVTVYYVVITPKAETARPYDAAKFFVKAHAEKHMEGLRGYREVAIEVRQESEESQHESHRANAAEKRTAAWETAPGPGLVRTRVTD